MSWECLTEALTPAPSPISSRHGRGELRNLIKLVKIVPSPAIYLRERAACPKCTHSVAGGGEGEFSPSFLDFDIINILRFYINFKYMTKKRLTIWIIVAILIFILVFVIYPKVSNYVLMKDVAEASSSMPFQFGGTITYYSPQCKSDPATGVCATCPMCTVAGTGVGNYLCNGYQEIQYIPAGGTHPTITNVCVPMGIQYLGGGTVPRVGGSIIGGGASNILPWVIGISK